MVDKVRRRRDDHSQVVVEGRRGQSFEKREKPRRRSNFEFEFHSRDRVTRVVSRHLVRHHALSVRRCVLCFVVVLHQAQARRVDIYEAPAT